MATLEGPGDMTDEVRRTRECGLPRATSAIPAAAHAQARPARHPYLHGALADPLIRLASWSRSSRSGGSSPGSRSGSPSSSPSRSSVWDQLIETSTYHDGRRGWRHYYLYEHLWASIRRILQGAAVAVLIGIPLGLLIGLSRPARTVLDPPLTFIRSLPPLAYFSLLVIWFGIDEAPKVVLLFLAALPPIVLATSDAVRNVSEDRVLALRTLGASRMQVVRYGVFPMVLPEVMTGIRVAVAFAFTTMVAAETINGMPGIGGMVRDAQRFNQSDVVILGIIIIGLCGIVLDGIIKIIDRVLVPWRGQL